MSGRNIKVKQGKWAWKLENRKFRENLIKSVNISKNKNNFIVNNSIIFPTK